MDLFPYTDRVLKLWYHYLMKKYIKILLLVIGIITVGYIAVPKSCDYDNFAWGRVHRECDCLGVKIDNSCKTPDGGYCPDAGGGNACIGIVTGRR